MPPAYRLQLNQGLTQPHDATAGLTPVAHLLSGCGQIGHFRWRGRREATRQTTHTVEQHEAVLRCVGGNLLWRGLSGKR